MVCWIPPTPSSSSNFETYTEIVKIADNFHLKWDDQVEKQVISIYSIGSELNSSTIPPLSSWSIVIGGVWIVSILPSQVIKIEVQ